MSILKTGCMSYCSQSACKYSNTHRMIYPSFYLSPELNTWCLLASRFVLKDKKKPIIFSMARLDRVKNMTGLVEMYGKNARLRELANLVIVAGDHGKESKDREEQAEFKKMYSLIDEYKLKGHIRWISAQMNRVRNGELYRYICDTKGAFVQVYAHTHTHLI